MRERVRALYNVIFKPACACVNVSVCVFVAAQVASLTHCGLMNRFFVFPFHRYPHVCVRVCVREGEREMAITCVAPFTSCACGRERQI